MIYDLPTTLEVNGTGHPIRTDYRAILDILVAFGDPDLEDAQKQYACLYILYEDFPKIPASDYEAAIKAAVEFIDAGIPEEKNPRKTMDWEQDAPIIFPAVSHVAGQEVRAVPYLHWWTFLGYFLEIKDGVFADVVRIRNKKARGKKLEKYEQEFWQANLKLCTIKEKLSTAEKEQIAQFNAILGTGTKK